MRDVRRVAGAVLAATVLGGVLAAPAQAGRGGGPVEVERRVEVVDVAGDVEQACDEQIRYTAGTITITTRTVRTPSGAYTGQEHIRSNGLTAVGLESGATYSDWTSAHFTFRSNPQYLEPGSVDGSHGVLSRIKIRLVADSDEVRDTVLTFHFMLQRTQQPEVGPPVMVFERFETTCP